jgi:hypothetical protein
MVPGQPWHKSEQDSSQQKARHGGSTCNPNYAEGCREEDQGMRLSLQKFKTLPEK